MTLIDAKESLKLNGYCDFELKDFNEEYYNLFEKIKYKKEDTKYLDYFKMVRFDYHNERTETHVNSSKQFDSFANANNEKNELFKKYDYEHMSQLWISSLQFPKDFIDEKFEKVYYDILEYFYNKTQKDVTMAPQWTCYSEGCFLKDHNDGQGDEYQNTCAILIYLNEEWDESWGGNLVLRNTSDRNDENIKTMHKVIPKFGRVAIIDLEIFDTSHAVDDIIGDHNRCTLLSFATSKHKKIKLDKPNI
jgi:Rps23 Pro-64 3,4-dihydroxylase Tpa1-like proline 4-hydroxylase